jgi:hypothetical protein
MRLMNSGDDASEHLVSRPWGRGNGCWAVVAARRVRAGRTRRAPTRRGRVSSHASSMPIGKGSPVRWSARDRAPGREEEVTRSPTANG